MALKPDRSITDNGTDISFFCNEINEKGAVLALSTAGSGAAMDDSAALLARPTTPHGSGTYIMGILLNDVVSGDLTKTHLNQHKDEVQVGSKVTLLRRGWIVTNLISGDVTAGYGAYAAGDSSGALLALANTALQVTGFMSNNFTRVGTWLSSKDADGYAKVNINMI